MRYLLFPLCMVLAAHPEAEEAAPDTERIVKLAEQLGAVHPDAREAASKELMQIGEAAWPVVARYLDDPDPERRQRVRELAPKIAVFLPDQQEEAKKHQRNLEDKDPDKRAAGLDGLLAMGPAGVRFLQAHLSNGNRKLGVEISLAKNVFKSKEKFQVHVSVKNQDEIVRWEPNDLKPVVGSILFTPLGKWRPERGMSGRRVGRVKQVKVDYSPIRDYLPWCPGEVIYEGDFEQSQWEVGIARVSVWCGPYLDTIHPRLPGSEQTVPLKIAGGSRAIATKDVFILPDFANLPHTSMASLDAKAEVKEGMAGGTWEVTVSLQSKFEKELVYEKNLPRYAWYLIADASGQPVSHGTWESVCVEPQDEKALAIGTIPVTGKAVWKLRIPLPDKPGRYDVQMGYQAGTIEIAPFSSKANFDGFDFDPSRQRYLVDDEHYDRIQGVTVAAPEKE